MGARGCLAASFAVVALSAALPGVALAAESAPAPAYRVDSLDLVFTLDRPARVAHPVWASAAGGGSRELLGVIEPGSARAGFVVPRRDLASSGDLPLEVGATGAESLTGWVNMLARPTGSAGAPAGDEAALRSRSLAYASLSRLGDDGSLSLGLRSHSLVGEGDAAGDLSALRLDGESLPGSRAQTVVPGDLKAESVVEDGTTSRVEWLHDGANPLRLTVTRDGDRLRYSYEYRVVKSLDQAVPVITRFGVPGGFSDLESLRWRAWDRVNSNKPPQFRADPAPGDEPLSMSQYPFLAARGDSGAYVGVLDDQGSSLFGRVDASSDSFDVEQWLWPRTVGQTYRWTFEVLAGYEQYPNAFLRALQPHTAHNSSNLGGGMHGPLGVLDTPDEARRAYADGVRVIFLHAWYSRNGVYFPSDRAMDEPYTTIWGDTYTYNRLKQQVRNGQAAGLKVYVYFQFAGVSQDIAGQFAADLVRNPEGRTVVAGSDGGFFGSPRINNLWADPDPEGAYGRSFLDQVDRMLTVIRPDGIALDRIDRLDFTYGNGYDYGSFDGYASPRLPGAQPEPATSITHEGVAMYKRLREVVDEHHAEMLSNLPTALPAFKDSDLTMIDQPMTPWSLFFMRAGSNGKPFFILDRTAQATSTTDEKCDDNRLLARLTRSHPTLASVPSDPDLCRRALEQTYANPRLQYVIPTGDSYPTYWLFADGTSVFRFDESKSTVSERYAGSEFVPLGGADSQQGG